MIDENAVFIETDVMVDFLTTGEHSSLLRRALGQFRCYTSVIQRAELFEWASDTARREAVGALLGLVRPLGLHPRMSPEIAEFHTKLKVGPEAVLDPWRYAISAAIARSSKLPILSVRAKSIYLRLDIPTINPESVR